MRTTLPFDSRLIESCRVSIICEQGFSFQDLVWFPGSSRAAASFRRVVRSPDVK